MGFGVRILIVAPLPNARPANPLPGSEGQYPLMALTPIQSPPRRRNA
jgi:hypothetical protein